MAGEGTRGGREEREGELTKEREDGTGV